MKKKIAIMLTLILAAGTFTACTAEEKMDNSSLSPTASTSVGVSASGGSSKMATTETMQSTEKATVSKETEPSGHRIPKPKKKPTVGKIQRLFQQRIRFRKHNPRFRTTAGIQRTVICKNRNRPLKKKLKLLLKSLCRSIQKSQHRNLRKSLRNRLQKQKRLMFSMR